MHLHIEMFWGCQKNVLQVEALVAILKHGPQDYPIWAEIINLRAFKMSVVHCTRLLRRATIADRVTMGGGKGRSARFL
jgi:hypothetical protein